MLFLTEADVHRLLDLDLLIESLERAFVELSAGRASVPPRTAARVEGRGLLGAMPGYLDGVLETKLVSVFPGNEAAGLPTHQALIALFDDGTGSPLAVMDGTAITALRTGAASAVATRALAREDARVLAVLGAGVQARSHLEAVGRVRDFAEVRIASRTAAGAHVTSVGAAAEGAELDAETVRAGLLVVESRVAFEPYPAGAHELQGLYPQSAVELGEVLAGTREGRTSPAQITVYKSMGHAVEDACAAGLVYRRAVELGVGTEVEL